MYRHAHILHTGSMFKKVDIVQKKIFPLKSLKVERSKLLYFLYKEVTKKNNINIEFDLKPQKNILKKYHQ